jgi:hypothetical protein
LFTVLFLPYSQQVGSLEIDVLHKYTY